MVPETLDLMIKIALVDDDPTVLDSVRLVAGATNDMKVVAFASNVAEGLEMIQQGGFDVLLCDLGLPDGSGIDLIKACTRQVPGAEIIVMTVLEEQSKVIRSIKAGARSYILKDENLAECASAIRNTIAGGSAISPSIARHLVKLFQPIIDEATNDHCPLTSKEIEILNLLARGFSVPELAGLMKVSKNTIATHVKSIYKKLAVNSRSQAVYEATSLGIIEIA